LIRFEGGKSLELAVSWAINQSPAQNGTTCRVHGSTGAVEVYTPAGPVLHRGFDAKGGAKPTELKQPKVVGHAAMLRQFRECILGKATPMVGADQGIVLMQMIEALYRSAESGKSIQS
jgi:predicted dehydrogenase